MTYNISNCMANEKVDSPDVARCLIVWQEAKENSFPEIYGEFGPLYPIIMQYTGVTKSEMSDLNTHYGCHRKFRISDEGTNAHKPSVANAYTSISWKNPSPYLVVWNDKRGIYGQLIRDFKSMAYDNHLLPPMQQDTENPQKWACIGENFAICERVQVYGFEKIRSFSRPLIASVNGTFMVLFEGIINRGLDGKAPWYSIWGQLVDKTGNLMGDPFLVCKNDVEHPAIGSSFDSFFVAWCDGRSEKPQIFGQLFDTSGNKIGSELLICEKESYHPSVVGCYRGPQTEIDKDFHYMVVWEDHRNGHGQPDIWGQWIRASTETSEHPDSYMTTGAFLVGSNFPIANSPGYNETLPDITCDFDSQKDDFTFFTVYETDVNGKLDIFANSKHTNGKLSLPFAICDDSALQKSPAVGFVKILPVVTVTPVDYPNTVVVWVDERQIGSEGVHGNSNVFAYMFNLKKLSEKNYVPEGVWDSLNKHCFIATAAYGTPLSKEINILRTFRDHTLIPNPLLKNLVTFYYKTSPPLANIIARNDKMRKTVRLCLNPIIRKLEHGSLKSQNYTLLTSTEPRTS